ncbi:lysophospholipid acyltransferase family protein [uncultured Thermosynechococcus sp.]|uniref:lysophospholipid acyltransferase family protein n=1 Tax=uncultured Thermosynechococcus sp. TaxID=436945 RepID=UPI002619B616|nr:lysophospholipid acyltransferase family protein [uncultured Thermosynechococcus sp.]
MANKKRPPTISRVSPWLYWGLWPIYHLFLPLYFSQIRVIGREQLPKEGGFVLAPKHYSRWDPVLLPSLGPYQLRFMTNALEFRGIQGWFIRHLGAFAVNLNHPQPSSLRHVLEILNAGQPLVIFPEGGIVRDQVVRPLKPGLARLVLQVDRPLPIFPVGIAYNPQPQFRARVALWIGSPLWTPAEREGNLKQQAQELTQQLEAALHAAVLEAHKCARL